MNSFEVNTLPYTVHTLLTYKTKDKYKGFIVKVMEDKNKKRAGEEVREGRRSVASSSI